MAEMQKVEVVDRHHAGDGGRQGKDVDQAVDQVRAKLAQELRRDDLPQAMRIAGRSWRRA